MKKSAFALLTILLISISLSACSNTIAGIGRDMQRSGEYITDSMKED